ncbi:MAG: NAD(P)/FAD-dependent oxidoreductase [Candidatus Dormibacterales bacterium]
MSAEKVAIVGGGATGDAAAFALRKRGFDGQISLVSADPDRPYDRPYLSKEFLRGEVEARKVFLHEEDEYSKQRIELHLATTVTGGSIADKKLSLDGGQNIRFDVLVLGLGGTPRRLPDAPQADNVLTLRSFRDSDAIRQAFATSSRLLVVGAGFIGAEVAASARGLGKHVLMLEAASVPLARALGQEVGQVYASIHRAKGVDLRTATTVKHWHSSGKRVSGVTLSDESQHEVDLVLMAVGIAPNLDLPKALGLPLDGGGVSVDGGLRAAAGVYVGGDVAFHAHPVFGRHIRVEHWEVGKGHGRGIAAAIVGDDAPYSKLPYFWSDQYDVGLEYRGHASGEDVAVWRGDREGLAFSVFYLREGAVEAVLSMNDKKTNELGGKLIESRKPVDAAALANLDVELASLLPPSPS